MKKNNLNKDKQLADAITTYAKKHNELLPKDKQVDNADTDQLVLYFLESEISKIDDVKKISNLIY